MPLKISGPRKAAPSKRRVQPARKSRPTKRAAQTVPASPKVPASSPPKAAVVDATGYGAAQRWTESLIKGGFTPVSDFFLKNYSALVPPISTPEALFIIHLVSFKWTSKAPRPSMRRIAERMAVSEVSVRGYARSLEDKKYLLRIMRVGRTNQFRLRPLFNALEALMASSKPIPDTDEIED